VEWGAREVRRLRWGCGAGVDMQTKVYVFGCKISKSDQVLIEDEIERGRQYYNSMIESYNPNPRQRPGDIRKRFPASDTDCYKGTYDIVASDFDRAVSAKRPGKWPGEPYHFRKKHENAGASVGVRVSPACPWSSLRSGAKRVVEVLPSLDEKYGHKRFLLRIKIDKEHEPIALSVALPKPCRGVRRTVPDDAMISHIRIFRKGDFATGAQYVVHVTAQTEDAPSCVIPNTERIGVDFGWHEQPNGALLVAVTSQGESIQIPAYAVRMWRSSESLRAERDAAAAAIRHQVPSINGEKVPKSPGGLAAYVKRHDISGFATWELEEYDLHVREDHVRRRFQNIRNDIYKKAAPRLGPVCCMKKLDLKPVIEKDKEGPLPKPTGERRFIASLFLLQQLLRNHGAIEVPPVCERIDSDEESGNDRVPTTENASLIFAACASGNRFQRAARKAVRKYRKKLTSSDTSLNAMATAS
jgi:hypothetical protein